MLGNLVTRVLVLLLGYAYPAFECFKTVEKNRVGIAELRFWCQYWIIVAFITACERVADIFVSWLPFYGEAKLAFFIYLWCPKTKGTSHVYETLVRPYVSKHEAEIDRKIMEWKARVWDFSLQYGQNIFRKGQTTFFQVLQYLASQSAKATNNKAAPEKNSDASDDSAATPRPPQNMTRFPSVNGNNGVRPPPTTPPSTPNGTIKRSLYERTKSDVVKIQPDSPRPEADDSNDDSADQKLLEARLRLRRSKLSN